LHFNGAARWPAALKCFLLGKTRASAIYLQITDLYGVGWRFVAEFGLCRRRLCQNWRRRGVEYH
jgi:hypothetical protein